MTTDQQAIVEEVLNGYTPIGEGVPSEFEEFVRERIASRPSPAPPTDPLDAIRDKLDEILTLLRGGTPE